MELFVSTELSQYVRLVYSATNFKDQARIMLSVSLLVQLLEQVAHYNMCFICLVVELYVRNRYYSK